MRTSRRFPILLRTALLMGMAAPAAGQGTMEDYQRAERFLGNNTRTLVAGDAVRPVWLESDRFWYRTSTRTGTEYVLVDPTTRLRRPAFDHARLAAALSLAADTSYVGDRLPFNAFEYADGGRSLRIALDTARGYLCDLGGHTCSAERPARKPATEVRSPDGRWIAFEREENLWVRSAATGEEAHGVSAAPAFAGLASGRSTPRAR